MNVDALYAEVTARLIAKIEAGVGQWRMPWHIDHRSGLPISIDQRIYRGVNSVWLSMIDEDAGHQTGTWGTYKAWSGVGCQVRKGQKGTHVILWKPVAKEDAKDGKPHLIARTYAVFATEQVDGPAAERLLEEARLPRTPRPVSEVDRLFDNIGAKLTFGGNRAYYSPVEDAIRLPDFSQFIEPTAFYSTLAHEHIHWTGHKDRCDRDLSGRFASESYGMEELVAELGAAMFCHRIGIPSLDREDHSEYLASWLRTLKADTKAIVSVSSAAQKASDFLFDRTFTPHPEEAEDGTPVPELQPAS